MIVIDCEQGTEAWLAARAGLATASCFGHVMAGGKGVTRRNYRDRLVVERLNGRPMPEGFKSRAMENGAEREPAGVAIYEVRRRVFVDRLGLCRHDVLEAAASPDGLVGDDGAIEVKCPEPSAHIETMRTRRMPSQYVEQVQGVMWICGRRWCDFISYSPDFDDPAFQLVIVRVPRDQAYIDRLAAEVTVFLDEVRAEVKELQAMPGRMAA